MALLFSGLITTTVTAEHQPVGGRVRRVAAVTAPVPFGPGNGVPLPSVGPIAFLWQLPAGATQYQLQVIPFQGDGPGVNLIRDAESNFVVPAHVLGQGPYVLLPGMSLAEGAHATLEVRTAGSLAGRRKLGAGYGHALGGRRAAG
ncbi:MAG: hypothetical protein EXR51_05625 [Dehalococcoidia bacterium]|nr:hypothetical protein [Dehalococcoidia bacterium]